MMLSEVATKPRLPTLVFGEHHSDIFPKEMIRRNLRRFKEMGFITIWIENIGTELSEDEICKQLEAEMQQIGFLLTVLNSGGVFTKSMWERIQSSEQAACLETRKLIKTFAPWLSGVDEATLNLIGVSLYRYPTNQALLKLIKEARLLGFKVRGAEANAEKHKKLMLECYERLHEDLVAEKFFRNEAYVERDRQFAELLLREHRAGRPAIFLVGAIHTTTIGDLFKAHDLEREIVFNFTAGPYLAKLNQTTFFNKLYLYLTINIPYVTTFCVEDEIADSDDKKLLEHVEAATKFTPVRVKLLGKFAYLLESYGPLKALSKMLGLKFKGIMHLGGPNEYQIDAELPEANFLDQEKKITVVGTLVRNGIFFRVCGEEGNKKLVIPGINLLEEGQNGRRIEKMMQSSAL